MAIYDVDPKGKFNKALKLAIGKLSDLTIPFGLMTKAWYKGNRSIFLEGRQGPGKYKDLSAAYKAAKTRAIGSPYPILRGFIKPKGQSARKSGKLAKSMIDPSNPDTIAKIINKRSLILGTKVVGKGNIPYPRMIQEGTRKMPARPFALIGGEQVATRQINQRKKNWITMLEKYAEDVSKGFAT